MRLVLAAAMLAIAGPVWAAEPATVRTGAHDGFGRVVFEFASPVRFKLQQDGDAVVLSFTGAGQIPGGGGTRNVVSLAGGDGTATLTVTPGARLRTMRLGNRVVLDVLDPGEAKPARTASRAAPASRAAKSAAPPPATPPAALPAPLPATPVSSAAPAAAVAIPAPVVPVIRDAPPSPAPEAASPAPTPAAGPPAPAAGLEPVALAASHLPVPAGEVGSAAVLPFGPTVAAAAFPHGGEAWLVFDERRPLDLAALGDDPVLAAAGVQLLPQATLIRLKMPADRVLSLERRKEGWALLLSAKPGATQPLVPVSRPSRLLLPATGMGQIVVVNDADTGQNLLVGTLRAGGAGVPVPYRVPEFSVLPSWQGVVVEPLSDRTQLRPVPEGFAIETGDALAPAPDNARVLADAAVLTRRFDFPADPPSNLLRRLQMQVADQSRAPAQARLAPRKRAAQTMLALGLGAEAQALLGLAALEDPRAADDADLAGLTAIAGLMSGRPAEAAGLSNPGLTGSDEIALWRAVRATMQRANAPDAAPVFAATMGLVLSYPAAMRNRLLPLAAETMAEGGAGDAADALLAKLPDEPLLATARAMRLAAHGKTAEALALYDALATGRDRLTAARAASHATMLRLASGKLGPAEAATALERQFMSWRGDEREEKLRLQAASLRAKAGQWRAAFALLRETAQTLPDTAPRVNAKMAELMEELLHGPGAAALAPVELVALADENAELIGKADEATVGPLLADKLMALDLSKRAGPIIERMVAAAPAGPGRATLGARLAKMRLGEGDDAGAAAALASSDAPDLPTELAEQRGLVDARLHARAHDPGGAAAILAGFDSNAADDLRATVLGDAGDWHGAVAALASLVGRSVPPEGALSPAQQDAVLRLASAQARAGDDASLRLLGMQQQARMTGPRADMFRLLTAAPVGNVGDLKRSAGEMALARAVPAALSAIGTR